jgi:cytochrome c biogenesis protein CcdA
VSEIAVGLTSALWLGILTSISPCPLATNIAAVSFLSKNIVEAKEVVQSGFAYTIGRMVAYALVGFLIVTSLLSVPIIAQFLQKWMNKLLGPILIIAALFLLDVVKLHFSGVVLSSHRQQSLAHKGGVKGSFALGFLFALSFCPVSAALFFGSLIPLALQNKAGATLPVAYGFGTGLPVLAFAAGLGFGVQSLTKWLNKAGRIEYYMRRFTALVFIVVGAYYAWNHVVMDMFR